MERKLPPVLWGALYALGALTLLSLFGALVRPSTPAFCIVAANAAIWVGLYLGHRWAFVLAVVCAAVGTVIVLGESLPRGVVVFLLNSMVVVPLILARHHFFPARAWAADDE